MRAASALLGLEQRRPAPRLLLRELLAEGIDVVEDDRARVAEAEASEQRRLRRLRQLERERPVAVEHDAAGRLERLQVRERERDRADVAADVGARAGLVEDDGRRRQIARDERRSLEIERVVADAFFLERAEERLLPLRMLEQHEDVRR